MMYELQDIMIVVFSIIAFFLLIPPFIWHLKNKNLPSVFLIFWFLFLDMNSFINSLIWSGSNFDKIWDGAGYCDFVIKLEAASSSGKISAIATILINLYMVLSSDVKNFKKINIKRKKLFDVVLCTVSPIFIIMTNYMIQSSRFLIIKYRGCSFSYNRSLMSIFFYSFWNIAWSIIATIFAILTLVKFFKKKEAVKDILRCTNSGLNMKRFARLIIFCCLTITVVTPLSTYYFIDDFNTAFNSFKIKISKYYDWNQILMYDFGRSVLFDRWIDIILSIVIFLLLGLGTDAIGTYKKVFYGFFHQFTTKTVSLNKKNSFLTKSSICENETILKLNDIDNLKKTSLSTMYDFESEFADLLSVSNSEFCLSEKFSFNLSDLENQSTLNS